MILGGHALLLAPARVGRRTLAHLAAMLMGACVFVVDGRVRQGGKSFRELLHDACCSAGVMQQQTVLIIDSTCVSDIQEWRDLVTVMGEGVCVCVCVAYVCVCMCV